MKLSFNRLEDILFAQGVITKEQHNEIRNYILEKKISSAVAITELKIMDLNGIYRAIAKAMKVEYVPIADRYGSLDDKVIALVSEGFKKQGALKKAKENNEKRIGATMSATLKHTDGLPLAKGVLVEVYYGPEKIIFKKDKQEIAVSREKVTSIDCVTGKDIKTQQMAGAATGKYVLGGTTGAIIGSLAATTTYLVISYMSEGTDKYIVLDTAASGTFPLKVQKDFKRSDTSKPSSIEL